MARAIITLTTDFGTRDGYVGAMKGVLARLAPDVRVVDLAHDIPRGDIAHAAWVVATAALEFPDRTVHVVVVDPGVGGARRSVIVRAGEHAFVGPDNGTFAYVTDVNWFTTVAWELPGDGRGWSPAGSAAGWRRGSIDATASPTFHGRDVFAPAAAQLATEGWAATEARPRVTLTGALPWGPRVAGQGRIVHVDHYGNLISDLPAAEAGASITLGMYTLPVLRTYEDVASRELVAYVGSARTIEIAQRDGRADQLVVAPRGTLVVPTGPPVERAKTPTSGPYR